MMKQYKRLTALLVLVMALIISTSALAAYATLRYGDRGTAVLKLQQALNKLGYTTGGLDSKYGPSTQKAVKSFQKDNGLAVDGIAGNATQTKLYKLADSATINNSNNNNNNNTSDKESYFSGNYATLEYADKGSRVKLLQQALKQLGYYTGSIDSKFGAGTQRAVVAFQKAQKLTADGKAGKKTLQRIEKLLDGGSSPTPTKKPTATPTPKPANDDNIPTRTLRKGATGSDVKSVQKRLKELG